jgi:hypothetical protein
MLDALAGSCDAARMKRREDRARADGVHTDPLRRVVGGEPPASAPGPVPEQDEFGWVHVCPGPSQSDLSDRKENGTAKHAKHAKGGGVLQVQDDAFDLKARLAEVEQQAEMQSCGFQIIQALRAMNVVDRLGYLQFDEDYVFDE